MLVIDDSSKSKNSSLQMNKQMIEDTLNVSYKEKIYLSKTFK